MCKHEEERERHQQKVKTNPEKVQQSAGRRKSAEESLNNLRKAQAYSEFKQQQQ